MENVFNPWRDIDAEHDTGPDAPRIRVRQLQCYLRCRLESATHLLVGEALGYQGGHFSGIAMTSERILLGHKTSMGIYPVHVLPDCAPRRTSKPELAPEGFSEPTATIVWHALLQLGMGADRFVLWNAFPWHPFDPARGMLSNRKPTREELREGLPVLEKLLNLFKGRLVIAVGKTAAMQFDYLGIDCNKVRHPARGGATQFRRQINILG
ncbi:MAG: uracil-DNA glycosylase [Candidatus Aureabacteria bacterium]|nr:uracil-DNA glycosylase [Candidatus Auribacterota bacterium]